MQAEENFEGQRRKSEDGVKLWAVYKWTIRTYAAFRGGTNKSTGRDGSSWVSKKKVE